MFIKSLSFSPSGASLDLPTVIAFGISFLIRFYKPFLTSSPKLMWVGNFLDFLSPESWLGALVPPPQYPRYQLFFYPQNDEENDILGI